MSLEMIVVFLGLDALGGFFFLKWMKSREKEWHDKWRDGK